MSRELILDFIKQNVDENNRLDFYEFKEWYLHNAQQIKYPDIKQLFDEGIIQFHQKGYYLELINEK